jgi:hypothetical protein
MSDFARLCGSIGQSVATFVPSRLTPSGQRVKATLGNFASTLLQPGRITKLARPVIIHRPKCSTYCAKSLGLKLIAIKRARDSNSYVFGQAIGCPCARSAAILGAPQILLGRPKPLPPRKRNSTLVQEVLERPAKSFGIGSASRQNATEGVSCCVVFGFRDCPGSGDSFMRESELLPGTP